MDIVKLLILLTVIFITLFNDIVYTIYVQCEKDGKRTVYIKNFIGSGVLNEKFGFCSNSEAVILIFKNCKVERDIIKKDALETYYPSVKTIVWECQGNCLIEETNIIVNSIRCRKGNFHNLNLISC